MARWTRNELDAPNDWYAGYIAQHNDDGTFAIDYTDDDQETNVRGPLIRLPTQDERNDKDLFEVTPLW